MSSTDDLRSEHKAVVVMLGIMGGMARELRTGGTIERRDVNEALEFLRVFVDQCHHSKEEQELFPALQAAGIDSLAPLLEQLLADHTKGRQAVGMMASASERLAKAEPDAAGELAETMDGYVSLLRDHIEREERDCFDAADRALPDSVQAELVEAYERIEREVVGEGRHEAFHALLERLSARY